MGSISRFDWFAGMALQGLMASETGLDGLCPLEAKDMPYQELVAAEALRYAEAMIKLSGQHATGPGQRHESERDRGYF